MVKRAATSAAAATVVALALFGSPARAAAGNGALHEWYGTVKAVRGTHLYLALRTGRVVIVDVSGPLADHRTVLLTPTRPVIVKGAASGGVINAQVILRSHSMPEYWPADH